MKLVVSQTSIGLCYTANGVDMPNKFIGMSFGDNTFVFSDTWNLYSIGSFSVISKDEATSIAWAAAKNCSLTLEYRTNNSSEVMKPDWSQMRSDVGLLMIPGQIHNNSANDALNYINMGNTTRHPLSLYPLWQTMFYFSQPIGDIAGIQVGVWGDTKEIAYCETFGFLGNLGPSPTSTDDLEPSSSTSTNQPSPSLPPAIIIPAVLAATIVIILAAIVVKKKTQIKSHQRRFCSCMKGSFTDA